MFNILQPKQVERLIVAVETFAQARMLDAKVRRARALGQLVRMEPNAGNSQAYIEALEQLGDKVDTVERVG